MKALCLLLLAAVLASGQDTITGSAVRAVTLPPDQVTFDVLVTADPGASQDQVLQSLQSAGVTAQNLIGITATSASLNYEFLFTIPYSKRKDTMDRLDALPNLTYSFTAGVSDAALDQARQEIIPQLVPEAKKDAEQKALLAHLTLGKLISVNEGLGQGVGFGSFLLGVPTGATRAIISPFPIGLSGLSVSFGISVTYNVSLRNRRERTPR